MPARFRNLESLPAFASDDELATALMGTGKITVFRQIVPLLERRGFPTVDGLMGGRYVPAVKAFFDREYRVAGEQHISAPDGPEQLGAYSAKRRSRAGS